jgi:polysaccharide export outer membrane protein
MFRLLSGFVLVLLGLAGAVQAQSSYAIRPGDVLQVQVLEDPGLNRSVIVLPDGAIAFPLVGTLMVGGGTIDQARAALTAGLAPNFAAPPSVFVGVEALAPRAAAIGGAPRTLDVFLLGEASSPGKKAIAPGTTLLQFLAETGGFTKFAATRRIQLRRVNAKTGVEQVVTFNYEAVQAGRAVPQQIVLAPGDVIVVPERRLFE